MTSLEILLNDNSHWIKPGGKLEGSIMWELSAPAKKIEINFFWYVYQNGEVKESNAVAKLQAKNIQSTGYKNFSFDVPEKPYSFSGNLFSINWAIECSVGKDTVTQDLIMSNTGETVTVQEPEYDSPLFRVLKGFQGQQ